MKKIFKKEIILVLFLAFAVLGVSGCVKSEEQTKDEDQIDGRVDNQDSQKGEDENEALELVGQDDDGWNIYRSKEYKFVVSTPSKCNHVKTVSYDSKTETFIFKCFSINISKIKDDSKYNEDKFLDGFQCYYFKGDDCVERVEKELSDFDIKALNEDIGAVKVIAKDGVGDEFGLSYYFYENDFKYLMHVGGDEDIKNIDILVETLHPIAKKFKIME